MKANRILEGLLVLCGISWLAAHVHAGATTEFGRGGGGGAAAAAASAAETGTGGGDIAALLKRGERVELPPGDSFSSSEARLELAGDRVDAAGCNMEQDSSRFWGRIGMPSGSSGVRKPSQRSLLHNLSLIFQGSALRFTKCEFSR